jgi:cobalt/nickel transport system permease protein
MSALSSHTLALTGLAGDAASPVHRLDPRAKLVAFAAITFAAVSATLGEWQLWVLCAGALVAIAATARIEPIEIWRRGRFLLLLVLAVGAVVPLVRSGGEAWALGPLTIHQAGLETFAGVAAKSAIGIASAVLLIATTSFPSTLQGLDAMRAPRLLTLIAGLMYRYLFVIADEVDRTRSALAARAYRPRHALQAAALGRAAASLFLRSYSRGERVHLAMLARGFDGRMPQARELALGGADVAFAAAIVATLLAARVGLAL